MMSSKTLHNELRLHRLPSACGERTSGWSGSRFAEQSSLAIALNRGMLSHE